MMVASLPAYSRLVVVVEMGMVMLLLAAVTVRADDKHTHVSSLESMNVLSVDYPVLLNIVFIITTYRIFVHSFFVVV